MSPNATRAPSPATVDTQLVDALVRGDEAAFAALVDASSSWMLRVARIYVPTREAAEEAVQDAWLNVLRSLDRFEGRSSLRTWLFTIVTNCAKRRGERERRSIPFADLHHELGEEHPDAERIFASDHARWPDCWTTAVQSPQTLPEDRLFSAERRTVVAKAADALPPAQRVVFLLRDVEGWEAPEVCNALELSESNQRVLLHRARSKVRRALEGYYDRAGDR